MTLLMKLMTVACVALIFSIGCVHCHDGAHAFECEALPGGEVPKITNFISADNSFNGTTICRMQYEVPQGSNLWQGMLAANQQQGDNFTYMATVHPIYGHFITTINGVTGADGYFWAIFDAEGIATPVGVDWLVLEDGDSFIFNYMYAPPYNASDPDHVIANYTGPCLNASVISANMPLTYLSTFITVTDDNTENVKAGTNFEPVCNQLVLFDQSQPSLYDVMMLVNMQIPLDIRVTLDTSNMTVMTLNNITNQGGYAWTPFNVKTNMTLPRDLSMTQLSDGDQIRFVFAEVNDDAEGDEFECEALPGGEVPKITNFISADNSFNGTTICMMQYEVPKGANLWQGMMAANQQQGDKFTFNATLYAKLGHFITTINGVTGADCYSWAIFDGKGRAATHGVDALVLEDGDSYIFNYVYYNASNPTTANYTGPCLNAPAIPADMPRTYLSTFITVADDNTENVKAGTNFKPVCNQLVLFDQSQPSLYDVMMLVNNQIPLDISVALYRPTLNMTVMTLNNITNQGGYAWTPFNVKTSMKLPRDLSMTQLSDGDQIRFVFAEVDDADDRSSGVQTMMSVILLLSSAFMAFFI